MYTFPYSLKSPSLEANLISFSPRFVPFPLLLRLISPLALPGSSHSSRTFSHSPCHFSFSATCFTRPKKPTLSHSPCHFSFSTVRFTLADFLVNLGYIGYISFPIPQSPKGSDFLIFWLKKALIRAFFQPRKPLNGLPKIPLFCRKPL